MNVLCYSEKRFSPHHDNLLPGEENSRHMAFSIYLLELWNLVVAEITRRFQLFPQTYTFTILLMNWWMLGIQELISILSNPYSEAFCSKCENCDKRTNNLFSCQYASLCQLQPSSSIILAAQHIFKIKSTFILGRTPTNKCYNDPVRLCGRQFSEHGIIKYTDGWHDRFGSADRLSRTEEYIFLSRGRLLLIGYPVPLNIFHTRINCHMQPDIILTCSSVSQSEIYKSIPSI